MDNHTSPAETIALIGDVGGTNTRLQLIKFHKDSNEPTLLKSVFYPSKKSPSLEYCVNDFLKEFVNTETWPRSATIALAAAPYDNKLKMVNIPSWPEVNGIALGDKFNIHPFTLINDFEAIGYAMIKVPSKDLVQLNDATKIEAAPMAVIGSGTGLGECVLQAIEGRNGKLKYKVCPTEGGHKDFAPKDDLEAEYRKFCLEIPEVKEIGYLSVEKAFCGPAIPYMYKFFCRKGGVEPQQLTSKDIFEHALKKTDPICMKTLEFYARLSGQEIGNFACDCLPYSGIYLVGNIINAVKDYFINNPECPFMEAYHSKDKVTNGVLDRFPIYIVTAEELGLLGAFVKAQSDAYTDE